MKDFCSYQKLLFFNAVTQLELKFKFICLCAKKSKCNKILQNTFYYTQETNLNIISARVTGLIYKDLLKKPK